ncbi:hypothetical protein ACM79F_32605, partial [Pseudomonas aeruginosa]
AVGSDVDTECFPAPNIHSNITSPSPLGWIYLLWSPSDFQSVPLWEGLFQKSSKTTHLVSR